MLEVEASIGISVFPDDASDGEALIRLADQAKRLRLLVGFGLALILILAGMPWPGRPGGRPLSWGL